MARLLDLLKNTRLTASQSGKAALLALACLALAPAAHAQQALTKQQEKNLVAFARLFGYVRYFHPSDEAQQVSWPMLATKGSRQMLTVQNDAELVRALQALFQPLGPTIQVFPTSQPVAFSAVALQPPAAAQATRVVSWQHQGLYAKHGVRLGRPLVESEAYVFLKNVDVSRYQGLPYEVDLTWRKLKPTDGQGLTFMVEHRPTLGGAETHQGPQRYSNQTLTATGNHYLFKGKIDTAAQQLDAAFLVPAGFQGDLRAVVYVLAKGQRVALAAKAAETGEPTHKQCIELVFTSPNLLAAPLFKEQSKLGDYVSRELVPGISCTVPLALAADAAHTYPLGDSVQLNALHSRPADRARYPTEWARYQGERTLGLPEVRLADVVESWNALRHGYAYWGSASINPDSLLHQTLRRAYANNTTAGFVQTMQLMLATLNDGHAWVSTAFEQPPSFFVPLRFSRAGGQVVVAQVVYPAEMPQVRRGDVVEAIDEVPVAQALAECTRFISGSPQTKEYAAFWTLGSSPRAQPATLRLRQGDSLRTVSVPRKMRHAVAAPPARANGWLSPGVYYYNLNTLRGKLGAADYQLLSQAKSVVFDIRNYPKDGDLLALVPLLLTKPADVTLFYNLNMLRPDQEGLLLGPNVGHYAPGPQHLPGQMYFLTDAVTQSYPETFLALVRALHLGTLVGRPTSGANGGREEVPLQGGLSIGFSGARALNADGSRHHTIGIQPDVLVMPSIESVQLGQDAILETALKLAQRTK